MRVCRAFKVFNGFPWFFNVYKVGFKAVKRLKGRIQGGPGSGVP